MKAIKGNIHVSIQAVYNLQKAIDLLTCLEELIQNEYDETGSLNMKEALSAIQRYWKESGED